MAQDIEDSLGGIYSILAQEFQLPLVEWAIDSMESQGLMEKLPKEITVSITTGIEALGRGHDLNKLMVFIQQLAALGPDALRQYIILTEFIKRVATALGINTTGLIKSETQIQQEIQAAQQQQQTETIANSGLAREIAKGQMQPQQVPEQ